MTADKIKFKLKYDGATHRFTSKKRDFKLLRNVKKQVASIVKKGAFELFWKDSESNVSLSTTADLSTAIDYATSARKSPSKTPRIRLVVREIDDKVDETASHTQEELVPVVDRQIEVEPAIDTELKAAIALELFGETEKEPQQSVPVHDEPTLFRNPHSLLSITYHQSASWSMAEERQRAQMTARLSKLALSEPTDALEKEEVHTAKEQQTDLQLELEEEKKDLSSRAEELKIREQAFKLKEEEFERRVASFEMKMEQFEKKFALIFMRMDSLEEKLDNEHIEARMDEMEERLAKIEEKEEQDEVEDEEEEEEEDEDSDIEIMERLNKTEESDDSDIEFL